MSSKLFLLFYIAPLIIGLFSAAVYDKTKEGSNSKVIEKIEGETYPFNGTFVFIISSLIPLLNIFFTVAIARVLFWFIVAFLFGEFKNKKDDDKTLE